jgi:hypothetical protein
MVGRLPHHAEYCSLIASILSMQVAFIGDERAEAPITKTDYRDVSRLLLHRLSVLQADLRRVAELRRGTASALESSQVCLMPSNGLILFERPRR